ncbi:MAG: arabinose operon transcriptional regulator AraC [Alphaproteobacteria bacterium]|nr:arabinose operon transcriptional regulator AraC [Alphaproteobacteria bacterium]
MQHSANDMDDHGVHDMDDRRAPDRSDRNSVDPSKDPQVQRIFRKLAQPAGSQGVDADVAPLFPGFPFDVRLVAGITPIERDGPLDFYIDRPNGMHGWIINLTVEGMGQVFDGRDAFTVEQGDLLLFPPEAVHFYGRAPEADKWWHRWVYFQPRTFWRNWLKWEQQVRNVHVLRKKGTPFFSDMVHMFAKIERFAAHNDQLSADMAFNRLEYVLLACQREDRAAQSENAPIDERVLAACHLISQDLQRSASVSDIAQSVCLSPSRLSHLFRTHLGMGVIQWRECQRLQYAKQLLRVTNVPIKSLSQMVGYDDPLYFSRVFRRQVGMSPNSFRARSISTDAMSETGATIETLREPARSVYLG